MKLAVLFGGISSEHDISCLSAASILRNLNKDKYEIYPVGITRDGEWVATSDFAWPEFGLIGEVDGEPAGFALFFHNFCNNPRHFPHLIQRSQFFADLVGEFEVFTNRNQLAINAFN